MDHFFFVIYVSCLTLLCCLVCFSWHFITCYERADLLGLSCVMCFCHFPILWSRSCMELDCIDSLSMPSSLLLQLRWTSLGSLRTFPPSLRNIYYERPIWHGQPQFQLTAFPTQILVPRTNSSMSYWRETIQRKQEGRGNRHCR